MEEITSIKKEFEEYAKRMSDIRILSSPSIQRSDSAESYSDRLSNNFKKIGELARTDIEEFMGTKVYLQTWVKVKENWRDSMAQLRNFGFTEQ